MWKELKLLAIVAIVVALLIGTIFGLVTILRAITATYGDIYSGLFLFCLAVAGGYAIVKLERLAL